MPVTTYLWDGDNILGEYDEFGDRTVTYTYKPERYGELLSQRRDDTTYYHQYDGTGSTRALTDESGSVTDTWVYDAWGNVVERTGTTENPFTWNGRWGYYRDEDAGNYYVRERRLDPITGAWSSRDRRWPEDSVNPYEYARNNPVTLVDPSGLLSGVPPWLVGGRIATGATRLPGPAGMVVRVAVWSTAFGYVIAPYTSVPAAKSISEWWYHDPAWEQPGPQPQPMPQPQPQPQPTYDPMMKELLDHPADPKMFEETLKRESEKYKRTLTRTKQCATSEMSDPCCGLTIIVFSLSGNAPNVAAHIQVAQPTKGRGPFEHDQSKLNRDYRREKACGKVCCPRPGDPASHTSCDEYPFASSTVGGINASTACVPLREQHSQGGTITSYLLADKQKYCVEVVP